MVEPAPAGGFKTRPSVGDQVSFTVRRVHAANAPTAGTVAQDAELERYLLGCGAQCRAVEVALETMREGEVATFLCKERHLPAPNIESVYPEEVTIRLAKIFRDVDLTRRDRARWQTHQAQDALGRREDPRTDALRAHDPVPLAAAGVRLGRRAGRRSTRLSRHSVHET